jgi:hypothetical protein
MSIGPNADISLDGDSHAARCFDLRDRFGSFGFIRNIVDGDAGTLGCKSQTGSPANPSGTTGNQNRTIRKCLVAHWCASCCATL